MAQKKKIFPLISLLLSVILAVCIVFVPNYESWFLALLLLNVIFSLVFGKNFGSTSGSIARILVGSLFIFSGFVKGVDPTGAQYVIYDYLEAYKMPWLLGLALPASFFLNMLEFTLGVLMVLNVKIRWVAYLTTLMMIGFTGMTLYDAIANPVPDCGCFGKAIILTNWQTFYKNLVIDAILIGVLYAIPTMKKAFCSKVQWGIVAFTTMLFLGFEYYNYRYLPVMNFLDWEVGKKMLVENPQPVNYYLTYKHKHTGEEKEYLSKDLPYSDTVWLSEWEYASTRVNDPNPKLFNLSLLSRIDDEDPGFEVTDDIIGREGYHFLIVAYSMEESEPAGLMKIWNEMSKAEELGYTYVLLTASASATAVADMELFKQTMNDPDLEVLFGDDTALKGMIRANPGVILMKGDRILGLWSWRNFPALETIDVEALSAQYEVE